MNNKNTAPLSKKITFRINASEYEKFQMLFKNAKLNKKKYTTSDFIRNIIFENNPKFEVIKTKTIVRDKPCKDESLKIYHLNRIGNNINQIAYNLNNGKHDIKIIEKLDNISELLKVMI